MADMVEQGGIRVAKELYEFVTDEVLPGTGLGGEAFWAALDAIVNELGPRNRALLDERDRLQARIDAWHKEHRGRPSDPAAYKAFLGEIGYLVPEGRDVAEIGRASCRGRVGQYV